MKTFWYFAVAMLIQLFCIQAGENPPPAVDWGKRLENVQVAVLANYVPPKDPNSAHDAQTALQDSVPLKLEEIQQLVKQLDGVLQSKPDAHGNSTASVALQAGPVFVLQSRTEKTLIQFDAKNKIVLWRCMKSKTEKTTQWDGQSEPAFGLMKALQPPERVPGEPLLITVSESGDYKAWVDAVLRKSKTLVPVLVRDLAPIYEHVPEGKVQDIADDLVKKYRPGLVNTGATYGFCRKGWKVRNKMYGLNVATDGGNQFMQSPVKSLELSARVAFPMINGEKTKSASLYLCWDADKKVPMVIVMLNLGKAAPQGGGRAPVPTSFVLWFNVKPPEGDAMKRLQFLLKSAE